MFLWTDPITGRPCNRIRVLGSVDLFGKDFDSSVDRVSKCGPVPIESYGSGRLFSGAAGMIFSPRREDNPMTTIRTILHPTDFSATSELAFAYACELARSYKARLIALHVVQPVVPVAVDGILVPIDVDELQREAQARFQQLPPATSGVDFERLVREGPAGRTIVQVAEELGGRSHRHWDPRPHWHRSSAPRKCGRGSTAKSPVPNLDRPVTATSNWRSCAG